MVFSRQDSGLVQCALVCVSYKQDERLPIFFPAEMLIDMMACCHLVTFTAIFPVEKFPPHFLKCLSFFRLTMYAHVQCMQYDRMFKTYIFLSKRTLNLKLQYFLVRLLLDHTFFGPGFFWSASFGPFPSSQEKGQKKWTKSSGSIS